MLAEHSTSPNSLDPSHEEVGKRVSQEPGVMSSARSKRQVVSKIRRPDWAAALLYVLGDVVCWVLIYAVVGYLRRDAFFTTAFEFVLVDCVVLIVILQALYIIGGYNRNTETRSLIYTTEHILAVVSAAAISSLIIYSAATFDAQMKPSRSVLILSFLVFLPTSLVYRRLFHGRLAASAAQHTFLVIGSDELAKQFYQTYKNSLNRQQLEFVDDDATRAGLPIAGEGSPIIEKGIAAKLAMLDRGYSGVILAKRVDPSDAELLDRLVRTQFQQTRVYTLESFHETHWRSVPLDVIDPMWPLQTGFQLARISPYHYVKRLFDLVVSGLLLLILWPLLVLLTLAIWLTSGRPAIFRQVRVGREGQPFTAYKFRTMRVRGGSVAQLPVNGSRLSGESDERAGAPSAVSDQQPAVDEEDDIYTREDDPRITSIGRWLRKLRLDELPQLLNVFRGEMSLIGPRAEWIKCAEQYETKIPFYHFRHLVKPGITGWAQVNYPYGESDEDAIEKLKYDLYYIRRYSLKLDAMIVLKTIHTILFGKGR